MGVYNPLIDMPVSCANCFTRGGSNCYLYKEMLYPAILKTRHHDCPLVEVKAPHGRLIDTDAFTKTLAELSDMSETELASAVSDLNDFFDLYASTVLEAEGKDDG